MEKSQRNKQGPAHGTPGSSRRRYRKDVRDQIDAKAEATVKLPTRPSPSDSASRVDSGHGVADESFEDDPSPRNHRRGHDYRNVHARESGRMHLGDNINIATQVVYSEQKRTTGKVEDGKQIDILEALAFEHMGTRLASISTGQDQTGRWLFDTEEYKNWRTGFRSSQRRFLWLKGKPGSGKSTLMAMAFQRASEDFKQCVVASFFFNARGAGTGRTTEGMYRTLLHQIFSQLPALPPGVPSRVSAIMKRKGFAVSMLQNMMRTMLLHLSHEQGVVCYIDALDECAEDDIRDAIRHFEELRDLAKRRDTKFLVCFASRHYPDITIRYHRAVSIDEQVEHQHDISKYVESALVIPDKLGVEIHDSVLSRCKGVFLWAVLTVKSLNKMYDEGGTRSELQARVREIPGLIQDLFGEIMRNRDEYLLPMLIWILYAKRPLSIQELYFAVKASTGNSSTGIWNRTDIDVPRMKKFLLTSSKGLVEFWEGHRAGGSQVHLIHESLREYLLASGLVELDSSMGSQVQANSHARLARWCTEYVSANGADYDERISDVLTAFRYGNVPLLDYVLEYTLNHIGVALRANVLPYRTMQLFTDTWLCCKLDRFKWSAKLICAELLYLYLVENGDKCPKDSFGTSTARAVPLAALPKARPRGRNRAFRYLAVVRAGSVDLVQLFRNRSSDSDFVKLVQEVLWRAAVDGQEHVLDLLLSYISLPKRYPDVLYDLLWAAAMQLKESTTKLMLQNGADPNAGTRSLLCSLVRADDPDNVEGDPTWTRVRIANLLLDNAADTKGALVAASKARRSLLVRLLTVRGATISRTAIETARRKGRDDILDMVAEAGAPVGDSTDESAYTSDASTVAMNGN